MEQPANSTGGVVEATRGQRLLAGAMFGVTLVLSGFALYLQLAAEQAEIVDAWGFTGAEGLLTVAFSTVGFIICRRISNPAGWIFCGMGVGAAIQYFAEEYAHTALAPTSSLPGAAYVAWVGEWIWIPLIAAFGFLLLVFPDDRIRSKAARGVAIVLSAATVIALFTAAFLSPLVETWGMPNPFALNDSQQVSDTVFSFSVSLMMFSLIAAAVLLIGRLRKSSGIRRQQLKWFSWAALLASVGNLFGGIPATMQTGSKFAIIGMILLPAATARAILRYRLYDIDIIVNRALVYGASTAALVGLYLGVVFGFQQILDPVTQDSSLAVVASTLLVVALFRPLRDRVQVFIDRRFYRSKYDAEATLELFGSRLRGQVELDALRADVLDVVARTVQPAHVSLWLRSEAP